MKKAAPFFILAAATLWATMGIVTRYVGGLGFTTLQTAAVRIGSAAIVLLLFLLLTNKDQLKVERSDFKWFLGTGLCSLLINNLAYAATVQRASLSVAVVLLYTAPFFVMIMSTLFFKEALTVQKITALLLSFLGCILVVGLSGITTSTYGIFTICIGLSAGFGYSLYSIFGKVLVGRYASLTVTTYTFLVAASGTILLANPIALCKQIATHLPKLPLIVLGSTVTLALPYLLYSIGLKYIESSKASIIASFEVVAASLLGVILYKESLNIYNIIGIVCVVSALIILQIKKNKL